MNTKKQNKTLALIKAAINADFTLFDTASLLKKNKITLTESDENNILFGQDDFMNNTVEHYSSLAVAFVVFINKQLDFENGSQKWSYFNYDNDGQIGLSIGEGKDKRRLYYLIDESNTTTADPLHCLDYDWYEKSWVTNLV